MLKHDFIGEISVCALTGKTGKSALRFLPEFGATPVALTLSCREKQVQLLDGFQTEEHIRANEKSRGIFLIPFPNRIQDGTYVFDEKKYHLPINKPRENNAIHGFLWSRNFLLEEEESAVNLTHVFAGDYPGFPFPFTATIRYEIADASCGIAISVTNTGNAAMPLGIGWHPYFTFHRQADDLTLQLPACNHLAVDARMIPTGGKARFAEFHTAQIIGKRNFDDAFECVAVNDFYETRLSDPQSGLTLTLRQDAAFKYVQVYIPPGRNSIALEPMTCPANAFNSGEGLMILQPGAAFTGKMKISLSEMEE